MRYPRFYEGIAARLRSAVMDGDLEALQKEALFCKSWGAELGLLGEFADAVAVVLSDAPAKPKKESKQESASPPPVAGGWVPN